VVTEVIDAEEMALRVLGDSFWV